MASAKPRVVDLFCGCGGLSAGFRAAGFEIAGAFDNWQPALSVYNANMADHAEQLDLSNLAETCNALDRIFSEGKVDGIIGGPPCQDFSSAGKRIEGDRADLTEKFASIVTRYRPRFFLMENVPRAQQAAAFRRAVDTLRQAGYTVTETVLDASLCGVPQKRKRLATVGFLGCDTAEPFRDTLLSGCSERPMTLRDYFGDELGTDYIYRHPRSYARRGVFSIDEPCPTVRGVNRPIPPGYPGHPGDAASPQEARPLTTEERARVQTFEGWTWAGSKTDSEQMIGNAVPVKLAEHIARAIALHLEADSGQGTDGADSPPTPPPANSEG